MRVLGLVTARAGSKGFPGKNLARLAGRPLVAWAHAALAGFRALRPELEVVLHLSTDGPAIADAWPEADRPRRLRPATLAADDTTSLAVVRWEVEQERAAGRAPDAVLLFQPTSPLVEAGDLSRLWDAFLEGGRDVIAVRETDHPAQWCQRLLPGGRLAPLIPGGTAQRRQQLEPTVIPVGVYLVRVEGLGRDGLLYDPERSAAVCVPRERAVDVDAPLDLAIAEASLELSDRRTIRIGERVVGDGAPCLVIAEAGVNHDGDPRIALELVRAAARAGADAVKFQTFRPADLVSAGAPKAEYQVRTTGASDDQLAMLERLVLPPESLRELRDEAARLGLLFFSTPFDSHSARALLELGVPAFKVGSGDATHLPFLAELAGHGLPLLVSTGMCALEEVEELVATVRAHGDPPLALLHCVSAYPAPHEQSNLRAMRALRLVHRGPVGFSDHSLGIDVALAAVAMGASIVEKHLTLDKRRAGPDHAASLEPRELAALVEGVRRVEAALGDGVKRPVPAERDVREVARRSLVAARPLAAGALLAAGDLAAKRPGTGLGPRLLPLVLGRRLRRALAPDQLLAWEDLE